MTKHVWCWGDIINPELADKALCAEAARSERRSNKSANDSNDSKPDPVAA
ncbi:MAG: hypothetical protein ACK4GD_08940 [Sphingomonadaceae bacterium]